MSEETEKWRKISQISRGISLIGVVFLSIAITLAVVLESFKTVVDMYFGTHSTVVTSSYDGDLWNAYTPDPEYLDNQGRGDTGKIIDLHKDFYRRVSAEGSVLLKNEKDALPLAKGSKITLLGYHSYKMILGPSAGPTVSKGSNIQFADALKDSGFQVNQTMLDVYSKVSAPSDALTWLHDNPKAFDPKEPSLSDLAAKNALYQDSFAQYSDAAIVVLSRPGREGADYAPGQSGASGAGARNALALTTNEKELVNLACSKFNKVIVLLNTSSATEIQELKNNSKINSIIFVGFPGNYGTLGIADILCGDANPSAGLYDIYASHTMSAPAMANMGRYTYSNANEINRDVDPNTFAPSSGFTDNGLKNYLIEAEGIYVGYRYYETRYYDCIVNPGSNASSTAGKFDSTGNWNYSQEVTYGFGFGESYTSFSQTLGSVTMDHTLHSITIAVPVKVKNTGTTYSGKSIVQVYAQAPYTQYDKDNGVEKSAVQLVAFGKTPELAPGQEVTITVDVDLQDLASYDGNQAKTYILDAGKYYFAVGNGAHDTLNNILAKQGKKAADGMDYDGVASKVYEWDYKPAGGADVDTSTFSVSKSGTKIKNQLEYSDWNDYEKGKVTHLSRKDWSGTWPKTYENLTAPKSMISHLSGNYIEINKDTEEEISKVVFGAPGTVQFPELIGADYDDSRWEELINQISLEEAIEFAFYGGYNFADIESITFIGGRYCIDGTGGPATDLTSGTNANSANPAPWWIPKTDTEASSFYLRMYSSSPVIASSFNAELAYEQGRMFGNDSLFAGNPILWGPAPNIHRHQYNGRNFEYYSEDPILSGVMSMEVTVGAREKGTICTPKHLAFNDQEIARASVSPFMTEQRAREIDLRAFQSSFEAPKYSGKGALGTMLSFTKLGGIECTAHEGLLKGVLRKEWGFNGYIVTDYRDDFDLAPQCFKAGLTGLLVNSDNDIRPHINKFNNYLTDAELLSSLKDIAHNDLYMFANSSLMNTFNTTSKKVWNMTWWRAAYISGISVFGSIVVLAAILYTTSAIVSKKRERIQAASKKEAN